MFFCRVCSFYRLELGLPLRGPCFVDPFTCFPTPRLELNGHIPRTRSRHGVISVFVLSCLSLMSSSFTIGNFDRMSKDIVLLLLLRKWTERFNILLIQKGLFKQYSRKRVVKLRDLIDFTKWKTTGHHYLYCHESGGWRGLSRSVSLTLIIIGLIVSVSRQTSHSKDQI